MNSIVVPLEDCEESRIASVAPDADSFLLGL